jgi:hypothetical protein
MKTATKTFAFSTAEVATKGPTGGNRSHGGRTYFKISEDGSTIWQCVVVAGNGEKHVIDQPQSIVRGGQGDVELEDLLESLEWAGSTLMHLAKDGSE